MKYLVSRTARLDLASIWEYTASRWSEEQADLYVDALVMRFAWLTRHVDLWQPRPDLGEGVQTYLEQNHVIVFRRRGGRIEVIRVLHGQMDLERHVHGQAPS